MSEKNKLLLYAEKMRNKEYGMRNKKSAGRCQPRFPSDY